MSLDSAISPSDLQGVKWAKLQRFLRQSIDNAGISYTMSGLLSDIKPSDTEGVKWAKLGAWMKLLADNIGGGGPGGSGDVVGPASATDGNLAVFDGATGKLLKDGGAVPGGAGGALLTATVTLTDAQIKALPTTPVQIIAAPGAGKMIQFISGRWILSAVAAYESIDVGSCKGVMSIGGVTVAGTYDELYDAAFADTGEMVIQFAPVQRTDVEDARSMFVGAVEDFENLPLIVLFQNSDVNFTGGNAANTLNIVVLYALLDI